MSDAFELEICQGKYRYRYEAGKQEVWRNGEPWEVMNGRLIGDKFVFSLAIELDEAIKERDALRSELSKQQALTDAAQQLAEAAQRRADKLKTKGEAAEKERDALRGKITEMERQVPAYWGPKHAIEGGSTTVIVGKFPVNPTDAPLYALPGAQPAPNVPAVTPKMEQAFYEKVEVTSVGSIRGLADGIKAAILAVAPEAKP